MMRIEEGFKMNEDEGNKVCDMCMGQDYTRTAQRCTGIGMRVGGAKSRRFAEQFQEEVRRGKSR